MDWSQKLYFTAFVVVATAASIRGIHGYAMVSGTVFCDQCKDGQVSLFDYPLNGTKVAMACPDNNGQMTTWGEETTNWLGSFAMRFDGTPDLGGCVAQVTNSSEEGTRGCGTGGGQGRSPRLMFRMFDMEMYTVDPLISQPEDPMSFCPRFSYPQPHPNPVSPPTPPSTLPVPTLPPTPPLPHLPPMPTLPPLPHLPPLPPLPPMPPVPYLEASACPHQNWMMPEYRCYWKVINPDSKVGVVFGLIAARKYGTDITLWEGMKGRGEPYTTLLREGTTALLNSYNSVQFPYHPLGVIQHMNWALMGSTQQVMHTALSFLRANSGNGRFTCKFNPCK
ncbi:protodermal factor 1 isoform X2 [Lycium ferocissimum]|uniref:protodermal factor 1 isoform X2 n=1 Tax=Lycium ferocissimum TaxID=112874 RepID=UPI002815D5DC|nr:protodermal factor 1 isoform X2 [Lycium ferocissimum]